MASDADRSRAKRIRKLGSKASPTQRKWLAKYIEDREREKGAKADKTIEAQTAIETTATPATASEPAMAPVEFPPEPQVQGEDDDDSDAKPLLSEGDMGSQIGQGEGGSSALPPQADSPTAIPLPGLHAAVAPAPVCGDPECPACSKTVGGSVCRATGKVVWAPIDDQTAQGAAMMILGIVGMIVSFITKRPAVEPTKEEIIYMGAAIKKSTYRRVNAMGAYDDLLMLGMALGMYANRARRGGE